MRAWIVAAGVVVAAIVVVGAFVLTRPRIEVGASVDSGVTVRCEASAGTAESCAAWGDDVLAQGPPSTTFELQDVSLLVIRRPLFGLAPTCEVDYMLGRYPDDPAWTEETPCR